jgi:hypothetical protein
MLGCWNKTNQYSKIFVLTAEDGGKEQLARLGVEVSDLL